MKLCRREEIEELREAGTIEIGVGADRTGDVTYLDSYRVGLRIESLMQASGDVDLSRLIEAPARPLDIEASNLKPGCFYLATTKERIRLGPGYFGSVHTRSKYARVGLEALTSSNFLVPGFGSTDAAPIVLEITARLPVSGLSGNDLYCFLLIYRGADEAVVNDKDYFNRYPMTRILSHVEKGVDDVGH